MDIGAAAGIWSLPHKMLDYPSRAHAPENATPRHHHPHHGAKDHPVFSLSMLSFNRCLIPQKHYIISQWHLILSQQKFLYIPTKTSSPDQPLDLSLKPGNESPKPLPAEQCCLREAA